jgi:hypothetical protein
MAFLYPLLIQPSDIAVKPDYGQCSSHGRGGLSFKRGQKKYRPALCFTLARPDGWYCDYLLHLFHESARLRRTEQNLIIYLAWF